MSSRQNHLRQDFCCHKSVFSFRVKCSTVYFWSVGGLAGCHMTHDNDVLKNTTNWKKGQKLSIWRRRAAVLPELSTQRK